MISHLRDDKQSRFKIITLSGRDELEQTRVYIYIYIYIHEHVEMSYISPVF